jgi:tetratricopeptide (TPR) repeat protein
MAHAQEQYGTSPGARNVIVRAGFAAFPYLSRRAEWDAASRMLGQVGRVDEGPATIAATLPRMRRVVEATAGTDRELSDRGLLARFLGQAGRTQEAERELRAVIEQAVVQGESGFRTASVHSSDLVNLLRHHGRYDEALHAAEQTADYTRRAGLGPWTQLTDEGQRLQILVMRGENETVLRRVIELREQMKALPDPAEPNEIIPIGNVREATLDTGHSAALQLAEWQQALDINQEIAQSKKNRGVSVLEAARTAFNDYGPLLRLRRYDEAGELLRHCREVFELENSIEMLGKVFGALADLEDELGRPETGQQFLKTALRYIYAQGDPDGVGIGHFNLSTMIESQGSWSGALAHCLAAVLITVAMQSGRAPGYLGAIVHNLRSAGPGGSAALPTDFDALSATVAKVEGVRFREMIERLAGGPAECDQLFRQVVASALEEASKPE